MDTKLVIFFVVIAVAIVSALNLFAYGMDRDGSWHQFDAVRRRRLVDGSFARGEMMRRRTRKGWQYRHMSHAEVHDIDDAQAW